MILVPVVVTLSWSRLREKRRSGRHVAMRRCSSGDWGRSDQDRLVAAGAQCGMCTSLVCKESVLLVLSREVFGRSRPRRRRCRYRAGPERFPFGEEVDAHIWHMASNAGHPSRWMALRLLHGKYGYCAGAASFQLGNGFMNTYGTWPRLLDTYYGGLWCERTASFQWGMDL